MMRPVALALCLCAAVLAGAPLCVADTWTDEFDYADGSAGQPAWRADSVTWAVEGARMGFEGGAKRFLVLEKLGHGRRVTVEAIMQLDRRTARDWAVAGLVIRRDDRNYWHLALVEAPERDGRGHSAELVESYEGRWLANFEGETSLTRTSDVGGDFRWEYGRPYRLRLSLSPEGVEGTVTELDGTLRRRLAYRFDEDRPAVKTGQPALEAALFAGYFDDVRAEVNDMVDAPQAEGQRTEFPPYSLPGFEGVRGEKTGFFHTEKQGDTWWMIDPNGLGFYAVGTDHINYNAHWCQELGYAPHHRFVSQKYGSEEKWAETVAERLHNWGFNTLPAGHSKHLRYTHFGHTEWFGAGRSFADIDNIVPRTTWTGFPNVFSPRWQRHCDIEARRICASNRDDPWLIGYFLDNELQWFGALTDWQNEFGLWTETWKKPADHTAKRAWLDVAQKYCPTIADFNRAWNTDYASFDELAASDESRRPETDQAKAMAREYVRLVAELYFKETTEAIRRHDPNHMVLGSRFAGWSPGIWDICGKCCDVVTFNSYPRIDVDRGVPADLVEEYRDIYRQAGKPLMMTEWSFPALDSGLPCKHGAGMRVATQAQKARCYRFFQSTLFGLPFFVGSDYFMYVDEPALGISDTFPEDSNYGLVNERDEPWPELTRTAAELNPRVYELHLAGKLEGVAESRPPLAWTRDVPPASTDGPALPLALRTGPLELESATGRDAWVMRYEGEMLGAYHGLIHQRAPGDLWTSPDESAVTAVREDDQFVVVDMTFTRSGGGEAITTFDREAGRRVAQEDEPPAYAAGWRFWIPKESCGWFGAQSLWVENTDSRAWKLAGLFHYTQPALGGSPDGDDEAGVNVPNFYIPLGAWEDREAGLGQAVFALGEGLGIMYWKGEDGFHSDCRQALDVELEPGERYEDVGPLAVHFAYRAGETADLLTRLEEVRKEVMALLP